MYTISGIYIDTLSTINGCDSVITMNLTIHNSIASVDRRVACDSTIWNGNVYHNRILSRYPFNH